MTNAVNIAIGPFASNAKLSWRRFRNRCEVLSCRNPAKYEVPADNNNNTRFVCIAHYRIMHLLDRVQKQHKEMLSSLMAHGPLRRYEPGLEVGLYVRFRVLREINIDPRLYGIVGRITAVQNNMELHYTVWNTVVTADFGDDGKFTLHADRFEVIDPIPRGG
jgi:hypothetical protein